MNRGISRIFLLRKDVNCGEKAIDQRPQEDASTLRSLSHRFNPLQSDPPNGVSAAPTKDDIMKWTAVMFGPEGTIWEGGTFQLEVTFTEEFPTKPPHVRFLNPMFHPNIYANGEICLDILQNQWSPIYDIAAILTSIQSLLCDPNPNSPANSEAARLWNENRREYNRRVTQCVEESWSLAESLTKDMDDPEVAPDVEVNSHSDDEIMN